MQLHGNARTCPNSRRLLVARVLEQGWSVTAAAEAAGVTERTVWRWLRRWRAEGEAGLLDRSSRPRRSPGQLPAATVEAIASLRRLRMTAAQIAEVLGLALSTVSAWLQRIGLGKRSRLEPPEPPNRYERAPSGRARARRHQAARPHLQARRRAPCARPPQEPVPRRPPAPHDRLRIRARDGRRPQPARLRRGAADADRALRDRASCAAPSPGSPTAASASRRS